jgi:hypothetical protein
MSLWTAAGSMVFLWLLGATTTFVDDSHLRLAIIISLNALRLGLVFLIWNSAVAWTLRTIVRGSEDGTFDAILEELEQHRATARESITQIAAVEQPAPPSSH